MKHINVFDYETQARKCLEPAVWDYYQGGSEDEVTMRENCHAFRRLHLRPRVLTDVTTIHLETTAQQLAISAPFGIAPMALQCMAHPEGECATARAASAAGTIMVVSTFASKSLEEIAQVAHGHLWLQLYVYRDMGLTETLVRRAEAAGYRAIVLTVDAPRLGRRERDLRNEFTPPPAIRIANFERHVLPDAYIPEPAPITWKEVAWLRSLTNLPLILKGIITGEDAKRAISYGADGIFVSNHGGRQLDGVAASIEALPEVIAAVDGKCEVYLDGGIRRGTDILKALALGARTVFIGRPIIWGLAVDGANGVRHVLELLRTELTTAMALAGYARVDEIERALVRWQRTELD